MEYDDKDFYEAQRECEKKGGSLVSVRVNIIKHVLVRHTGHERVDNFVN